MPLAKGISCKIYIAGSPAQEYDTQTHGSTTTCSIISEEDKPFSFELDLSGSVAERHDYQIFADGLTLARLTSNRKVDSIKKSSEVVGDTTETRELRFSKLETVDQKVDDIETRANTLKDVGTLACRIWRSRKISSASNGNSSERFKQVDKVHEKALKGRGVPHKTALGAATYQPTRVSITAKIDPEEHPYVIFKFRYTSKSVLQSEGLIPRSPSPDPSIKDSPFDESLEDMSAEDLRREVLRLRNDKGKKKNLKRERHDETIPSLPIDPDELSIQSVREIKRVRQTEVINLIDIDD